MKRFLKLKIFGFLLICMNPDFATANVFMQTTVTPNNPYVQSEILYQVKIYYDVNVISALIYPPNADNAIIKQLGQDQIHDTQIRGKKYQIFQRNFVIFPQSPGSIVIKPAIFRGDVTQQSSSDSYAGFYSYDVKPLQLISQPVSLSVKPIPTGAEAHWWLPAKDLIATEIWSATSEQVNAGEPLTRKIFIKATGLMASQLPQISSETTAGYNSYASQPELQDTLANNHLVSTKTEKIVYIPNATGVLTLPAITIYWWNTKTDKLETIVLPSKNLNVLAGTNPAVIETAALAGTKIAAPSAIRSFNLWLIVAFVFLLLWLLTLVFGWWFWRNKNSPKKKPRTFYFNFKNISLKQACEANDPYATKNALIRWAQDKFKPTNIYSISDIISQINEPEFLRELYLLQSKLYKQTEIVWSGGKLWNYCKTFKVKETINKKYSADDLPALHPEFLDMRKAD